VSSFVCTQAATGSQSPRIGVQNFAACDDNFKRSEGIVSARAIVASSDAVADEPAYKGVVEVKSLKLVEVKSLKLVEVKSLKLVEVKSLKLVEPEQITSYIDEDPCEDGVNVANAFNTSASCRASTFSWKVSMGR
jgi:hypothetical protein